MTLNVLSIETEEKQLPKKQPSWNGFNKAKNIKSTCAFSATAADKISFKKSLAIYFYFALVNVRLFTFLGGRHESNHNSFPWSQWKRGFPGC